MGIHLSLITVTWNHRDEIAEFLDAVRGVLEVMPSVELIIVDNASDDGTAEFVQDYLPAARVIANEENRGFAGGCNDGLAAADGDYLMLLNPDCFAEAEALAGIVRYLRRHPDVGATGCRLLHDDGLPQISSYSPVSATSYFLNSSILYPFFERAKKLLFRLMPGGKRPRRVGWLMGSCIAVGADIYREIGGLEESYFMYAEDADWCERIRRAGYDVVFLPGLTMTHRQKGSSRRAAEFTFRRLYRSYIHYANRNLRGLNKRLFLTAMMVDMIVRIPVYMLLSIVKPDRKERLHSVRKLIACVWASDPDLFDDPPPGRTHKP